MKSLACWDPTAQGKRPARFSETFTEQGVRHIETQQEEAGYLSVRTQVVGGKVRKYYRATEQGRLLLEETLPKLRELVSEVLQGQGPARLQEPVEEETTPAGIVEVPREKRKERP